MGKRERAERYLANIDGAVAGQKGHEKTIEVAGSLVRNIGITDEAELLAVLQDVYNPKCAPPWSEKELRHKAKDAIARNAGKVKDQTPWMKPKDSPFPAARPYVLRDSGAESAGRRMEAKGIKYRFRGIKYQPYPGNEDGGYDLDESMPENPALWLMQNVFNPHEWVRVCTAWINESGKEIPSGGGISKTAKEWAEALQKFEGGWNRPRGMFHKRAEEVGDEGPPGIYIGINPYSIQSTKDADIQDFRHVLLEFDDLEKKRQWDIMHESQLPVACIIDSGKRSLHAWVRVDAKDREEYDERVAIIYAYFSEYKPDNANKNPGRLSRAPGALRLDSEQVLISRGCGKPTFVEWLAEQEATGSGEELDPQTLLDFDPDRDPSCLIGRRYLCRGGSFVLVAQSGIGKSTLATQAAFTFALGLPLFGIYPARPLKSLIVQAENDMGDIAEQAQGVIAGMGLDRNQDRGRVDAIFENVKFCRDTIHTGEAFCRAVSKLIEKHSPDLVWIDPLLSFLGGDVSKQEVCSKFLRNGLNPIAEATGVSWMVVHHTGKPPKDSKAMAGWTSNDYAYLGSGSSELTNWARAVAVITQTSDNNTYLLQLAKRGGRAGATDRNGNPTTHIHLAQATDGTICWNQIDEPEELVRVKEFTGSRSKKPEDDSAEIMNAPDVPAIVRPGCEALAFWLRKHPEFDPYQALEDVWGKDELSWTAIVTALQSYGRLTGNGPTGNGSASQLAKDIAEHVRLPSGGQFIARKPNTKKGRVKFLYSVERPDSSTSGEKFDDVPFLGEELT
jgi:RecA-family ATPase